MKKYRLGKLLSDTRQILSENYLAWASVTGVFALIYWLLLRLPVLMDLKRLQEESVFEVLAIILVHQLLTHGFLRKYYLILLRQPDIVKRNFLQAIKFTFTDGFKRRLQYYLSYLLVHGLIFLLFALLFSLALYQMEGSSLFTDFVWEDFVNRVLDAPFWFKLAFFISIYCSYAYYFMVPYIIQDTLSSDNILISLTFWACLKHSVRLMKGHKKHYFALTGLAFLAEFIYINFVSRIVLTLVWSPLSFLATGFLLIVTVIKFMTVDTYLTTARAILADVLLTEEWQIAFFGGEDE